jgi:hypothetical protein
MVNFVLVKNNVADPDLTGSIQAQRDRIWTPNTETGCQEGLKNNDICTFWLTQFFIFEYIGVLNEKLLLNLMVTCCC